MSVNLPRGSIIRNGVLYNGGAGGSFYQTTPVTASSGATSVTITDAHLHSTSLVMPFADDGTTTPMSPPSTITLSEGQAVLTFDALTASTDFTLIILSGSGAGGGGGQTMLNDLTDVNISSVSDGQILAYNGTSQKWVNINFSGGGLKPHLIINTDTGLTVTATKGTTVVTATETSEGVYECDVDEFGTYTLSDTENTKDVVIDTVTIYQLSMTPPVPEGATVTPTDDIDTWIKCAGLENTNEYSTLVEVLEDTTLFDTLLRDSNACDYMARSTTWAVQEGLVPTMTSATTPSGEASAKDIHQAGEEGWRAFNGVLSTSSGNVWASSTAPSWLQYDFGYVVNVCSLRLKSVIFSSTNNNELKTFRVEASNDNSTFTPITDNLIFAEAVNVAYDKTYNFVSDTAYRYWRIVAIDNVGNNAIIRICWAQFYEDTDITTDADAMARVGKYDYCANKLLANFTWRNAICGSDYFESVLNKSVPKMTDNEAPSGKCTCSRARSGYGPYKAFDGVENTFWQHGSDTPQTTDHVGYIFTTPVKIYKAYIRRWDFESYAKTFIIEGSNDTTTGIDGTWISISDDISFAVNEGGKWVNITPENNYKAYRLRLTANPSNAGLTIGTLNFYGRSDATDYVSLVPNMTSNTAPSGVCSASSIYGTGYEAYKAFDGNFSGNKWNSSASSGSQWIQYQFVSPTKIDSIKYTAISDGYSASTAITFKFQKSTNGIDWTDITGTLGGSTSNSGMVAVTTDTSDSAYYRCQQLSGSVGMAIQEIQLCETILNTNQIHSCPNDTIYMLEEGNPIILATTNSDGVGEIDWSDFEAGTYTLYSTVAKDPNNLSNAYSKSIVVTKTQYGGTTDAYIMPDAVKTLYWWGYESNNCEDTTTDNGWALTGGSPVSFIAPTHNTNNISASSSADYTWSGIGSKTSLSSTVTKLKAIGQGISAGPNSDGEYFRMRANSAKTAPYSESFGTAYYKSSNIGLVSTDVTTSSALSAFIAAPWKSSGTIYAFWYE